MAPPKSRHMRPDRNSHWLVLKDVHHAKRRKHLLGSVIPTYQQYDPLADYAPHWGDPGLDQPHGDAGKKTKKEVLRASMQRLWQSDGEFGANERSRDGEAADEENAVPEDPPVQLNNVLTSKAVARTRGAKLVLTNFFDALIRRNEVEGVEIESGIVERYEIDNAGQELEKNLWECEPWREQLQAFVRKRSSRTKSFCLITGVMICKDLTVYWRRQSEREAHAKARADANSFLAAYGVQNQALAEALRAQFEIDQRRTTDEQIYATCRHDVVFAVRLHELELTYENEPNWFTRTFFRASGSGKITSVVMGEDVLGEGFNAYAGSNEDLANVEDADDDEDKLDFRFYISPAEEAAYASQSEYDA